MNLFEGNESFCLFVLDKGGHTESFVDDAIGSFPQFIDIFVLVKVVHKLISQLNNLVGIMVEMN